ncbi:MAG: PHP domain-containing protein [Firmicutes bacterium]|nr:PHP domain-containing protein [Bacillota bacterium]
MRYDLHVHTTASDGVETPEGVVLKAVEAGLQGVSITDHDTLDGLAAAEHFIQVHKLPLELIPGIELNTDYGTDEVHILGYFIDYRNEQLINRLEENRKQRKLRAVQIVSKLQEIGITIEIEEVEKLAQGNLIGRPHIARALCQKGYVQTEEEAFHKYIERGRPAYVPRYKFTPTEAIDLIHQAGGVAVLAHPGLIKDRGKICEIISIGIEGLEIYYPEHSADQIVEFALMADAHHLLKTGGSDFHGAGGAASRSSLGSASIDQVTMEQIRACYEQKKQK